MPRHYTLAPLIWTEFQIDAFNAMRCNKGRQSEFDAGWSSLVARRAHNPKVVGSNPAPATNSVQVSWLGLLTGSPLFGAFLCLKFAEDGDEHVGR